jgi:Domain of unknown function (DUF5615)
VSARHPIDTPSAVRLLLDEMHSATISAALRNRGHDVVAIVEQPELRAFTDHEVFAWAAERDRRIVTENAKDFRRILLRAEESGETVAGLLLTSSRTFPRSRRILGPIIDALDRWLQAPDASRRPREDWLLKA